MSLPLSQGSNAESVELPADTIVKICSSVSTARITNLFQAGQLVWLFYTNPLDDEPTDISLYEKVSIPTDWARFENGAGQSNLYAYAVGKSAKIRIEA